MNTSYEGANESRAEDKMTSKLPMIIVLFLPNRSIMNPLRRLPSICIGEPKLTEKTDCYFKSSCIGLILLTKPGSF